jgi:SAM-dependent methyltransferase
LTNPSEPPDSAGLGQQPLDHVGDRVAPRGGDRVDFSRPSPARRYNELQGGKDNLAADRRSAAELEAALPSIRLAAAELRRCLERQVAYLVNAGIRQFLDIGCGLPHQPNIHEIAQAVDATSRIVYVDCDKLVGAHARALLIGTPQGVTEFIDGDLTDIATVLDHKTTRTVLDLGRPIGVLLGAVLHFITDDQQAHTAVNHIKSVLAPGSHLSLTHVTYDPLEPGRAIRLTKLAESLAHGPFKARTRDEVAEFLRGLHLVEPGVVSTVGWRPRDAPAPHTYDVTRAVAYAAIGRVP